MSATDESGLGSQWVRLDLFEAVALDFEPARFILLTDTLAQWTDQAKSSAKVLAAAQSHMLGVSAKALGPSRICGL